MTTTYPGYPPGFSEYLAACRKAFEITRQGRRIALARFGREFDEAGWRAEFLRKLDERINLRAGLAWDGAARRAGSCRCLACVHARAHDARGAMTPGESRVRLHRCPSRDHQPYGRKRDQDYQADLRRDQRAVQDRVRSRIAVHRFLTPEARRHFSHLESGRDS